MQAPIRMRNPALMFGIAMTCLERKVDHALEQCGDVISQCEYVERLNHDLRGRRRERCQFLLEGTIAVFVPLTFITGKCLCRNVPLGVCAAMCRSRLCRSAQECGE